VVFSTDVPSGCGRSGGCFVYGEKVSRRDFLSRALGMGVVAMAALVLAACVPGEEDDDDEGEDD